VYTCPFELLSRQNPVARFLNICVGAGIKLAMVGAGIKLAMVGAGIKLAMETTMKE
jgi:hypothetical protein